MHNPKLMDFVSGLWDDQIVPQLIDYIRIPNKSPMFDADWVSHGYMEEAVSLLETWARAQPISGMQVEVIRLPGRTPLIFIDIPGKGDETVLLYGHLDKQPEMRGWFTDLGPWIPVKSGDKLYGRGGADDGYALYASLGAIMALQERGADHARCVVLIEACEESGSYDLPAYMDFLAERIGSPSLVVCLDSGAGNYEQLWLTTSLRGLAGGTLNIKVLEEGVHSGDASGVVPSSFRILRQLLDRIEDSATGRVKIEELFVNVPQARVAQARKAAEILGDSVYTKFPFVSGMRPMGHDVSELVLNRTWRPTVSVTGAEGLPAVADAGNVLRPHTAVKLSIRLPPTLNGEQANAIVKEALERDPPYGSQVRFECDHAATGWEAPNLAHWLTESVDAASKSFFGPESATMGEGGSIPFMGMLSEKYPKAQFVITGLLGPHSNAHGPNEFLHIPTGKKLTASVAKVLADHYQRVGTD